MLLPSRAIEKVIEGLGFDPKEARIEENNWGVIKGSAIVIIKIIDGEGFAVYSPMVNLPKKNLVGLYRFLLESNFTEATQAHFFLLNNVIHIGRIRPLKGLDRSEIKSIIAEVAILSDKYDDYLENEFGARSVSKDKRFG